MFLAVSQQNPGTKVQTRTKEQEQVQGYFLPPYGQHRVGKGGGGGTARRSPRRYRLVFEKFENRPKITYFRRFEPQSGIIISKLNVLWCLITI